VFRVAAVRFGVYVPTFGEYDVPTLTALASEAEDAEWNGFFIWDHLLWAPQPGAPLADTTVALTAVALATERVRFGALVTALARRRHGSSPRRRRRSTGSPGKPGRRSPPRRRG
jgi:hypothetical protein